jgi:dihydropteroate synthase
VDTWHAKVAREAGEAGAAMINDIGGGRLDPQMHGTVAQMKLAYICMHSKGTPSTMQHLALYENVVTEVLDFFIQQTENCRQQGIVDVVIDPGFGFAKEAMHNFQLLHALPVFQVLSKPILLGISRKSTIYKTLGITAGEALNGSTVLHTLGLMKGVHILRVHDVKPAMEAIRLVEAYTTAVKK